MQENTAPASSKCCVCLKSFGTLRLLKDHTYDNHKPFLCYCGAVIVGKNKKRRHKCPAKLALAEELSKQKNAVCKNSSLKGKNKLGSSINCGVVPREAVPPVAEQPSKSTKKRENKGAQKYGEVPAKKHEGEFSLGSGRHKNH